MIYLNDGHIPYYRIRDLTFLITFRNYLFVIIA